LIARDVVTSVMRALTWPGEQLVVSARVGDFVRNGAAFLVSLESFRSQRIERLRVSAEITMA
jgi:hypothetical protein